MLLRASSYTQPSERDSVELVETSWHGSVMNWPGWRLMRLSHDYRTEFRIHQQICKTSSSSMIEYLELWENNRNDISCSWEWLVLFPANDSSYIMTTLVLHSVKQFQNCVPLHLNCNVHHLYNTLKNISTAFISFPSDVNWTALTMYRSTDMSAPFQCSHFLQLV